MAGRRVYGGSSMVALLQSEGIPHETIEAWLGSSSSPGGLDGAGSMVNFEDVCGSTTQRPFYRPTDLEETGDEDLDECLQQPEKKRRLTVDQVQILEKNFEIENKLEPERKIQLARDLGLQPRQVAIWFQNRRARWKTKQLEKDYEVLKSSYNVLKTDYENLAKENEKLKAEVRSLTDKLLIKEKGNSEALKLDKSSQGQNLRLHAIPDVKRPETSAVVFKQEDVSSGNSAVLDSDSPHCTDGGQLEPAGSSNAIEPDHSDLSHTEDDGEVRACCVLKLEDNSNNYGFPMEDQSFWCWPY